MKLLTWALIASLVIYASSSLSNASLPRKSTLEIHFPSSVELPIGTSVVLEGRRIGFLAKIAPTRDSFTIVLEEELSLIHQGAMAVVSSTWATDKKQSLSFIEILNPLDAQAVHSEDSLTLPGYADFESFWGSREISHWVDNQPYTLG